ncbi:MAG: ATP12 family protein [Pontixanthobacter sp.]
MKRFYTSVTVDDAGGSHTVLLDGKAVRTPLGARQSVPTSSLAEALAAEWRDQSEAIDLRKFRMRDHADYAIDIVQTDRAGQIDKLLAFLETDTLCYRADPDEALFARQEAMWEPILTAFELREDVRQTRISGVMHRPQPPRTLDRIGQRLARLDSFRLAGLFTLTSLASSLTVGLSALDPDADDDALWAATNLEEDWQIEQWGVDADAAAVRDIRHRDFNDAAAFLRLLEP